MKKFIEAVQQASLDLDRNRLNSINKDLDGCLYQHRLDLVQANKKLDVVKTLNNSGYSEIDLDGYEATINAHHKKIDEINRLLETIADILKVI